MKYRQTQGGYENQNKMIFEGVGEYNIPQLEPVQYVPKNFVGFHQKTSVKNSKDYCVHFFIDDYLFQGVWKRPELYAGVLQKFGAVLTTDFSKYIDFPKALRIYQHFRNHWLGAYWQSLGMTVIPTISWGEECDLDWCFDGDPVGSVVAVSSVGTNRNKKAKEIFVMGFNEMLKRLQPTVILFCGNVPSGCEDERIVKMPTSQDTLRGIISNGSKGSK